jgi:hypothetical protein
VRDLSDLISPDEANAETSADEDLAAPPVEEVAATETVVETEDKGALTGKARKRAKAQAKADRLKQEKAKASEAKANAPEPEPVAEEAPAAEAAGEETGETEES